MNGVPQVGTCGAHEDVRRARERACIASAHRDRQQHTQVPVQSLTGDDDGDGQKREVSMVVEEGSGRTHGVLTRRSPADKAL